MKARRNDCSEQFTRTYFHKVVHNQAGSFIETSGGMIQQPIGGGIKKDQVFLISLSYFSQDFYIIIDFELGKKKALKIMYSSKKLLYQIT